MLQPAVISLLIGKYCMGMFSEILMSGLPKKAIYYL
jgi:hypothetical protein